MWIYETIVLLCYLTVQGQEECDPGKYGDACNQNCSQNCKPFPSNIVLCHKETGKCFEGCKADVYGDQCNEPCSKNCLEHICNQHNGHCTRGCIENHIGDFCETSRVINTMHQGTTYSSNTTVTTGVVPPSSSQVIIPVVVTVLVLLLILVGAVVIIIWRRKKKKRKKKKKKKKKESAIYLKDDWQGFLSGSPRDGQDTQDFYLKEPDWMKDIKEIKDMMMRKMRPAAPQPSDSSGISTPTPARRDAREDHDLHDACWKGKLAEVKRILDTGRTDVNCRGVGGMTPVMWASLLGCLDVVELLVSRGADVSLVADDGNNILHCACMGGDRKTVEFVLSLDRVDINSSGGRSRTLVMLAAWRGHRDVLEILVSRGADVSLVDDDSDNILHYACRGGDRKTVKFVLSLDGVDINVRNNKGQTAADEARREGHRN